MSNGHASLMYLYWYYFPYCHISFSSCAEPLSDWEWPCRKGVMMPTVANRTAGVPGLDRIGMGFSALVGNKESGLHWIENSCRLVKRAKYCTAERLDCRYDCCSRFLLNFWKSFWMGEFGDPPVSLVVVVVVLVMRQLALKNKAAQRYKYKCRSYKIIKIAQRIKVAPLNGSNFLNKDNYKS